MIRNSGRVWCLLVFVFWGVLAPLAAVDWSSEILYFVLLDRFQDGDRANNPQIDLADPRGFHGGDLPGLRSRLDYLQDLGVTAIWVSPVFRNRPFRFFDHQPYHGYWIWDFLEVDPRFGTMEDLRALAADLHRRGMKLVLDFVVNHADYNAPLAAHFPSWFHPDGNIEDWEDPQERETRRIFGLPDFASEKPVVQALFQAVAKHWIDEVHPDGFRLDAVKHVPTAFWSDFNRRLAARQGKGFLRLGEMLDGDPRVIGRTAREGSFNALFDFPLYYTFLEVFARNGDCRRLGSRAFEDWRYPADTVMATFLDNHDLDRFLTSCDGGGRQHTPGGLPGSGDRERLKLALGLLFTWRGLPTLMYGDETGLAGAVHPDAANRCDMRFDGDPEMRDWVQELARMRRDNPSLGRGLQMHLAMTPTTYAFLRVLENEVAVVALNLGSRTARLELPCGALFDDRARLPDRLGPGTAEVWGRKFEFDLRPNHLAVFLDHRPIETREAAFRLARDLRSDAWAAGTVPVTFLLETAAIPADAIPRVIGALPELGDWNPASPLPEMVRVGRGAWRATIRLPRHAVFEYKFCFPTASGTAWYPEGNLFGETSDRPPKPLSTR